MMADATFVKATRRKLMDLSQFMKELKQHIAVEVNRLEGRGGPLWAGRFKSKPIDDDERGRLVRTMVYIDLNPLAAGLCDLPEDGLHTSLSARLGRESVPTTADGHPTRPASGTWLAPFDGDAEKKTGISPPPSDRPAAPPASSSPASPSRVTCASSTTSPGACVRASPASTPSPPASSTA